MVDLDADLAIEAAAVGHEEKLALADYEMALKIKPDYDEAAIGKGRILGN